jgi:MFS family permease
MSETESVTGQSSPERQRQLRLPSGVAFWVVAAVFGLLMFAASAPSPLYAIFQARWRFSATSLTAVFAVYAVVLLVTLLIAGSLSDYVGRRPVIVASLLVEIAAVLLFLVAGGVGALYAARALQGVAVGAATSALSAALIDLQPPGSGRGPLVNSSAPGLGLALGALATSVLVQYGPAPTHFVWWLLMGTFALTIPAVLVVPESVKRRSGALRSLRPRLGVPRGQAAAFLAHLPALVAVWALGGFYLSLGPSLAAATVHSRNLLWGGLVIVLLTGVGSVAALAFRGWTAATALRSGTLLLLGGSVVTLAGIMLRSGPLLLSGTGVAGIGWGLAFLGVFRSLLALAADAERARLVSTIYMVSYLAFSIPALAAGVAVTHAGLHDASLGYGLFVAALSAVATLLAFVRNPDKRSGDRTLPPIACSAPMTVDALPLSTAGQPRPDKLGAT